MKQAAKATAPTVRIGLALGGGAARGAAHVGVLQALEDRGISPACLSGTSIGAFMAALRAFGVSLADIRKTFETLTPLRISSLKLSKFGLLSNEEIRAVVQRLIGRVNIEDAPTPLAIVAADISTGEKVVLRSGHVATAVMASTCVAGIFTPVEVGGRRLVDGGIVEDVPLSPLHDMGAEVIVAVNLSAERKYKPPEDIIDVIVNAFDIAIDENIKVQIEAADVVIEPRLATYSRTDNSHVASLVTEGYAAAVLKMDAIQSTCRSRSEPRTISSWQKIKRWLLS